ncbi:MAG TPA: AAA family ATPase, partial [Gammaproteobacteria bacterium]|nr:AAA family ATPase [Gammaproteobacteria bacterium]
MNPKMTSKEAAALLGISPRQVHKRLVAAELPFMRNGSTIYFGYPTARQLFRLNVKPQAISFQIVKGGTGKTSLACAVAVRANLYGLRVLCIDLDQQGNLTNSFGVDAESLPVMIDILAEGYTYEEAITRVYPGMDVLASRIENALLDDVIKLKRLKLDQVYKIPFAALKEKYDLIVIDCPPNLGQSVAAVTLAVDQVIAPVIPESYALSGLKATRNAIRELEENYKTKISLAVAVNKHDPRAVLSQEARQLLIGYPVIHNASEFPESI